MEEEVRLQNNLYIYILSTILVLAIGFVSFIYNTNGLNVR